MCGAADHRMWIGRGIETGDRGWTGRVDSDGNAVVR